VHDLIDVGFPCLSIAIFVVQVPRPVDAQADQELCSLKKRHQASSSKRAIGLNRVLDRLPERMFLLVGDHALKKSSPISVGSPPCQAKVISGISCDEMYCWIYTARAHSPACASWICRDRAFFFQVKTIFAIQVADRPDGLGHHVVGRGGLRGRGSHSSKCT